MSNACATWTFGSVAVSPKEKLRPMPIEGPGAQKIVATPSMWWPWLRDLSTFAKVGLAVCMIILIAIPIIIVVATSEGSEEEATSTLTLRKLTYTCTDNTQTPSYNMIGASGSTHSWKPAWEGTLYAKDPDGAGATGCLEEYQEYPYWPPVTLNSTLLPALPAGVNATLGTKLDSATGYYHLTIGGCIAYYYSANTATAWWNGISTVWPAFSADHNGAPMSTLPACA